MGRGRNALSRSKVTPPQVRARRRTRMTREQPAFIVELVNASKAAARTFSCKRLIIIADGNMRYAAADASVTSPYAPARENVECLVNRLASAKGEMAAIEDVMITVASHDNIVQRAQLVKLLVVEFEQLLQRVRQQVSLAGVAVATIGDIQALATLEGGARLIEITRSLAAESTPPEQARLRLRFAINYHGDQLPSARSDTLVVRTGMESDAALRTSGLTVKNAVATTTLFPALRYTQLVELIRRAHKPVQQISLAAAPFIMTLSKASRRRPARRRRLRFRFAEPAADIRKALDAAGIEHTSGAETIECRNVTVGGRCWDIAFVPVAKHTPHNISAQNISAQNISSVLLPTAGHDNRFHFPFDYPLAYANAFTIEGSPDGLARGLARAERFAQAHPALRGGWRPLTNNDEQRFVARALSWAATRGIAKPGDPPYIKRAQRVYARIAYQASCQLRDSAARQPMADVMSHYMLAIHQADLALDAELEGESSEARRTRLLTMCDALLDESHGASESERPMFMRVLHNLTARFRATGRAQLYEHWQRYLRDYVSAVLFENGIERTAADSDVDAAGHQPIAAHVQALQLQCQQQNRARQQNNAGRAELALLQHLKRVATSIGAGGLLLVAAFELPDISAHGVERLCSLVATLDYSIRLANDAADGFADRDPKDNALKVARRHASAEQVTAATGALIDKLRAELGQQTAALKAVWPELGCVSERAIVMGHAIYDSGKHPEGIEPIDMQLSQLEQRPASHAAPPQSWRDGPRPEHVQSAAQQS